VGSFLGGKKSGIPLLQVQVCAFKADPMLFLSKLKASVTVTVMLSLFIRFHI